MITEKIIRIFSGVVVGAALAKHLTPSVFGVLALIQTIIAFVAIFSSLGLEAIVVKKMIEKSVSSVLGSLIIIKLCSTIFALLIAVVIMFIGYDFSEDVELAAFVYLFFIVFTVFDVFDYSFQSMGMPHYKSLFMFFGLILSTIAKILCIYYDLSLVFVAMSFVIEPFVVLICFFLVFNKYFKLKVIKNIDMTVIKSLLKETAPLLFAGIIYTVYTKVDQFMIQYYLTDYDLGLYSAALRVTEPLVFIPVIILTLIFPRLIKLKHQGNYLFFQLVGALSQVFYLISFSIIVGYLCIGGDIFIKLFGSDYVDSLPVVFIQLCSLLFVYQITWMSRVMVIMNLQKYEIPRTILGVMINVILNYLFIHKYGIIGAAFSTLITMIFSSLLWQLYFKEVRFTFYIVLKSLLLLNLKKISFVKNNGVYS